MRFIRILAIILAAFTFTTGVAAAQEKVAGKYGDWTMKCVKSDCWLEQTRITKKDRKLLAEVTLRIRKVQGGARVLMIVNTPDRAALSVTPAYVVDNAKDAVKLSWRTCFKGLCRAAAVLTPKQQGAMMAGDLLRFGYRKFQDKKTTAVPVSLRGVTAGLTALAAR